MKFDSARLALLRKRSEQRLSDNCKCGHSIKDDHTHGFCDECDCELPSLDEVLNEDASLIAELLDIVTTLQNEQHKVN